MVMVKPIGVCELGDGNTMRLNDMDWWRVKNVIRRHYWKYPEDYPKGGAGVWRKNTWYWSPSERLNDFRNATRLYREGKWKIA